MDVYYHVRYFLNRAQHSFIGYLISMQCASFSVTERHPAFLYGTYAVWLYASTHASFYNSQEFSLLRTSVYESHPSLHSLGLAEYHISICARA
jgi:hypothetical protein